MSDYELTMNLKEMSELCCGSRTLSQEGGTERGSNSQADSRYYVSHLCVPMVKYPAGMTWGQEDLVEFTVSEVPNHCDREPLADCPISRENVGARRGYDFLLLAPSDLLLPARIYLLCLLPSQSSLGLAFKNASLWGNIAGSNHDRDICLFVSLP